MNNNISNVIIIGSGPAGLTAGIYTGRANLKPVLIAGVKYGGQLMDTTMVENFPGFPEGIMGPELMQKMLEQAKKYETEVIFNNVTKVNLGGDVKKIYVGEDEYLTRSVVITVGSRARRLDIIGEQEFWGKGVSTCATCDGAFYKDKVVAVIGGGDSAMEEATFLTKFAKKVYIVHRRDSFKASQIMQERALNNKKIEVIWNSKVKEVFGDRKVTGLKLENTDTNEVSDLEVDGMFLAIGHIPNTEFMSGQIDLNERGYVQGNNGVKANIPGVFVAGEIIDDKYKQAVVSAGMGCMAAMEVEKYLAEND